MKTSESIKSLSEALAKAQGEIGSIRKDASVTVSTRGGQEYGYTYLSLPALLEASKKPLSSNGLAMVFSLSSSNNNDLNAMARLTHSSGEWIEVECPIIIKDAPNPMQALGSAKTYARRYMIMDLLNLAADDDDDAVSTSVETKAFKPVPNFAPRPAGEIKPGPLTMPFGKTKGTKLSDLPREEIESAIGWAKSKGKFLDWAAEASVFLTEGGGKSDLPPPPEWGPVPDADQIPF